MDGRILGTMLESKKLMTGSSACMAGLPLYVGRIRSAKTTTPLDSVSSAILTVYVQANSDLGKQLGEYWLHGVLDLALDQLPL